MCGICGIYDKEGRVSRAEIEKMNETMVHRGPDGEGVRISGKIGFGHRRLSIIDPSESGKQPMSNEDGTIWITFNGEIYNYRELREELLKKGHSFRSTTDTETIIHLYEEKGVELLRDLRGMFAFAIYDEKKDVLFLARDRIGERPLVYAVMDGRLYFASEIPAILAALKERPEIDLEALHYLFLRNLFHIPAPYTIFKGIRKLEPASYLLVEKGNISVSRYWKPSFAKQKKPEKELVREYLRLLEESVRLQLMAADVEVGLMLSGGVDSGSITAMASRLKKGLRTYALGNSDTDPEILRAERIATLFRTAHKRIIFEEGDITKLPELISLLGEPLALLPAIHSYSLSNAMSKELKVALTGNGGDELFYGYDGSNNLLLASRLLKMPKPFRKVISHLLGNKEFALMASLDANKRKGELYRTDAKDKLQYYAPGAAQAIESKDFGWLADRYFEECDSDEHIEKSYYAGLMFENSHSVTVAPDLTGLAYGLELRSPLLDHKLIEFAAGLPVRMKVRSEFDKRHNKYIMKKAMEGTLPTDILYAKKMGFGYSIRLESLLRDEWKRALQAFLFERSLSRANVFNMGKVKELYEEHVSGRKNNAKALFAMLVFEMWYELFIEKTDMRELKEGLSQMLVRNSDGYGK